MESGRHFSVLFYLFKSLIVEFYYNVVMSTATFISSSKYMGRVLIQQVGSCTYS